MHNLCNSYIISCLREKNIYNLWHVCDCESKTNDELNSKFQLLFPKAPKYNFM